MFNILCQQVSQVDKRSPKYDNRDRALEHFDMYYKPVYNKKWPSMRISLLTAKKYCVIMNNFCNSFEERMDFLSRGAKCIIDKARKRQATFKNKNFLKKSDTEQYNTEQHDELDDELDEKYVPDVDGDKKNFPSAFIDPNDDKQESINQQTTSETDRRNLEYFMPAETVYSESTAERIEEARQSVFTPRDIRVDIVKPGPLSLPADLCVLAFPPGNVDMFPEPEHDASAGHRCMLKSWYNC